jgi:hypothetical protein
LTGEIIHADVNGPRTVSFFRGARYYICFKDDYSKYRKILFLKMKNDVGCCLRMFVNEATYLGHVDVNLMTKVFRVTLWGMSTRKMAIKYICLLGTKS